MRLSLRTKLLIILVAVSVGILSIYAAIVLHDFKNDKLAYIYDAVNFQSESVASQVQTELDFYRERLMNYYASYSDSTNEFRESAKNLFLGEKSLRILSLYEESAGGYQSKASMLSYSGSTSDQIALDQFIEQSKEKINQIGLMISVTSDVTDNWFLAIKITGAGAQKSTVLGAAIQDGKFVKFFKNSSWREIYLIDDSGGIMLRPNKEGPANLSEQNLEASIKFLINQIKGTHGTIEHSPEDSVDLLLSSFQILSTPLKIVTVVSKDVVTENVRAILIKSFLFLGLLIFVTILISLVSSKNLTSSIKKLYEATIKISEGDFKINVDIKTKDEMESLAGSFNKMAGEIERLMLETAEKTRMEQELKTAQIVQSTLFPAPTCSEKSYEIEGFYQPASECGGDWYFYSRSGRYVHLFMGDATGHGVPAALVTSSARAAVNVLEEFPDLKTSETMGFLNRAIHSAAKGKVLMTFFLAKLDTETGQLTYCNASHEPPFVLPPYKTRPTLKKSDLGLLFGDVGSRLGESPESTYKETEVLLEKGSRVLVFTDGMTELVDPKGDMWGERRLSSTLVKGHSKNQNLRDFMQDIKVELDRFRSGCPLHDDLTYFMIEYKG